MSQPRINLYNAIHKGLRAYMSDTLNRCARIDGMDVEDVAGGLAQVRELLALMHSHLEHERDCLHPALEAAERGSSTVADADHDDHGWAMEKLLALCAEVEETAPQARDLKLEFLQRELSAFIGESLLHMHMEETINNAVLWVHYTDSQLIEIHHRILERIGPDEQAMTMCWIVPALTPNERAAMLVGMRQAMPPAVFAGVLDMVRRLLNQRDCHKLDKALRAPEALAA